jgi:hypothetical protein
MSDGDKFWRATLRPLRRSEAATWPKARAASLSKGIPEVSDGDVLINQMYNG